ncbi:MAG: DUF1330 domain-containing protein [Myxococcales bacterium]|nr:DUF1330 domain-containing protein [Deltaproteobacteria bacterium]NNE17164.1 DUF1330 domain-containing protein [Myxococcales bacterium]
MSDSKNPAYTIVRLNVKDYADYMQRYGFAVGEMLRKVGAEVLVASETVKVLEGEWEANWTVVIRFPSLEVAEQWYHSPEYQPLKELRMNELTEGGPFVMVEGFDASLLGL